MLITRCNTYYFFFARDSFSPFCGTWFLTLSKASAFNTHNAIDVIGILEYQKLRKFDPGFQWRPPFFVLFRIKKKTSQHFWGKKKCKISVQLCFVSIFAFEMTRLPKKLNKELWKIWRNFIDIFCAAIRIQLVRKVYL